MSYLYELEGIYAQLQAMDLDDETFKDTLESIDFEKTWNETSNILSSYGKMQFLMQRVSNRQNRNFTKKKKM